MSTPIFTPDGLLKQVEYASLSPSHSSPILVISSRFTRNSKGFFLVVATRKDTLKFDNIENYISHTKRNSTPLIQHGQSRIIQIPISDHSNSSIMIGASGLLPDAVSLIEAGRNLIHSLQSAYGLNTMDPMSCAREVAECIADKCEEHALGGGIRPYGAELFVCSVRNLKNTHPITSMNDDAVIYITQPSGAIFEHYFKKSDNVYNSVIVFGGTEKNKLKLYQNAVEKLKRSKLDVQSNESIIDSSTDIHESVKHAIRVAISTLSGSKSSENADFDIVVIDSIEGFIRLSQDDIHRLKSNDNQAR